jgi:hypothetical protein
MKKILIILGCLLLQGCMNPYDDELQVINLGVESTTTSIKSVFQNENIVIMEFETTIGSKYSIQIIPFGQEIPIKKEGLPQLITQHKECLTYQKNLRGIMT